LLKGQQIIGQKVMTLKDGREIGRVEDLIVDDSEGYLKGIVLENRSILRNAKIIPWNHLVQVGRDALIISGQEDVLDEANDLNSLLWRKNTGKNVISITGTEIGTIKDLVFDKNTGKILGFELSGGIWADLNQGRKMIPWAQNQLMHKESFLVDQIDENLWN
jgi:uncharacterized protein YrrD